VAGAQAVEDEVQHLGGQAVRLHLVAVLGDGEADGVVHALNEQYMPRGAGAELPQTLTGAALAVADKLDTLVG
ncbi:glycine--tRNA ligase subunit beta, partial [Metapseudomonas otitidis]|uniref:glycine--tRNA ligase subunit beta n=1 Tax=Metapseudomonas otitidis TaxID=319939 RepID=UPI00374D1B26